MEVAGGYVKQIWLVSGWAIFKPNSPIWIPQLFSNLVIIYLLAYEDGTDRVFRNVGI